MIIDKTSLLKSLRVMAGFDNPACIFLGVQLPTNGKPQFHRSSVYGFIQTKDFDLTKIQGSIFASLTNFKDLLSASEDTMELFADSTGHLHMDSTEGTLRLQVYTVRKPTTGFKDHTLGNPSFLRYSGDIFNGFDIRPFKGITQPPTLLKGKLLLNTVAGTVIWTGQDALRDVQLQPREAFLRFIAEGGVKELLVSQQGYWIAERDGMICALSGHKTPPELLSLYAQPGVELVRFSANRLISSLSQVSYLTSDTDRVELNPKEGIVCRDKYTNPQIFPSGAVSTNWSKTVISGRTAKLIVDALSQTTEDNAVLYSIASYNPVYRIVRGAFEVNFGLV